jgi:hypothetical protein
MLSVVMRTAAGCNMNAMCTCYPIEIKCARSICFLKKAQPACSFCLACSVRCGVHKAFFRTWRHVCSVRVEGCFDTFDHQKQAEPKKNGHPNPLRFLARYSAYARAHIQARTRKPRQEQKTKWNPKRLFFTFEQASAPACLLYARTHASVRACESRLHGKACDCT